MNKISRKALSSELVTKGKDRERENRLGRLQVVLVENTASEMSMGGRRRT